MIIRKPIFYDSFRCLAGSCPDSCCQEWDVAVDDHSAAYYRELPGALGDALRQHLYREEDCWYLQIQNRRCPMWQQDGLCRIQAQLGEQALCQVCREFPRLRHDYGDFAELGLELSCPEAARLMLAAPIASTIECTIPGGEDPEYDRADMDLLLRSRSQALELLEAYPMEEAMALLLLYGYRVQEELDGGDAVQWEAQKELALAQQLAQEQDWQPLMDFYAGLEVLTPRWAQRLASPAAPAFPTAIQNFLHWGIQRYWLQTISDLDLVCRVKMLLAGALLVGALGGDPVETAQLYSKEIDNSSENLEAILDAAYTHPALTDQYLLGLMMKAKKNS